MAAASAAAACRGAVVPGKRECMALLGVLLAVAALAGPAAAADYKVGDAIGWTIRGSPNYTAWSLSKTFRVGDSIVFEYNNNIHNVLEVSRSNYDGCNAANPISTHTTGKDSIALKTAGHHYFICGIPTHCSLSGQKVDVNVLSSSSSPSTPAPAPAPAPASSTKSAPAPASSSTPAAPSVPSAASSPPPSPASGAPPSPKSAAPPSVGSGHYLAGCAVALLAAAMSLSLL